MEQLYCFTSCSSCSQETNCVNLNSFMSFARQVFCDFSFIFWVRIFKILISINIIFQKLEHFSEDLHFGQHNKAQIPSFGLKKVLLAIMVLS